MVGRGGGGGGADHSGNRSRFKVMTSSLAEEDAFDLQPLRTGIRSGLLASIANMAKGTLGGGILASHVAFMNAGCLSGTILTFIYGLYMAFNFYILVVSAQRLCKRTHSASLTYPDCGEAAFALFPNPKVAKWSKCYRVFVDFIACVNLFGTCACYQIMVAKGIKQLMENVQETGLAGLNGGPSLRAYIAMMIIPTILICLIRELKYLAPLSLAANVVIAIVICATVHYAFERNPHFEHLVLFTTLYHQVVFTGVNVFTLSCAGVVIPIENNMKEPQKFYIVIGIAYLIIILAVILASFFGYVAFTSHCESPITSNFPMETFPKVMKWGIVLMTYITHALGFYMPFECVFYYIKKRLNPARYFRGELICRAFFVILISIIAIIFPNIDALMGFLGCFCLSNMAFICPNTIYVLVHYERPGWGKRRWRLWRSIALSVFGVFILICGSIVTGKRMVETLFEEETHSANTATTATAATTTTTTTTTQPPSG